jgi:FO synthase
MTAAAAVRDAAFGSVVTFSPKVFIPLTRLCRDDCGYCTFSLRATPDDTDDAYASRAAYMSLDEVLAVARAGAAAGATEALFTLGDAPESAHASAAAALRAMGHVSTVDYVAEAAAAVLNATGLLPHVNAGLCSAEQAGLLKGCSVSQGLMLESTSLALHEPGGAHHDCATKLPAARLAAIDAAGAAGVPFTSGILIGIGETRSDRIDALLALRGSHDKYGHLQEAIVQNFRAKGGTRMASWPEPSEEELLWSVAVARLALPGAVSVQAPPNLQRGADATWRALLCAGINDWGGVSPGVTRDHVNPEAPWPMLPRLAAAAASCGKALAPRLAVYPRYMHGAWLSEAGGPASVAAAVRRAADAAGLARGHPFLAGLEDSSEADATSAAGGASSAPVMRLGGLLLPPAVGAAHALRVAPSGAVPPDDGSPAGDVAAAVAAILARAAHGGAGLLAQPLSRAESALLFGARGAECDAVCGAADALRSAVCGGDVAYVVNRNINYTNVCTFGCTFCAFSKGPAAEAARGASYLLPPLEVGRRAAEAWSRGATEVCLQGGIHPDFDGDTYLRYLAAVKAAVPDMHVHAFSPLEVTHGAQRSGRSVPSFLAALRDAGLGSLPGTAAEILDTRVRPRLCPDKLSASDWCDVVSAAHAVGLRTTSTIMFGHLDDYEAWATHLQAVRDVALSSPGMVTEFVPLPFVHPHAPVYRAGSARRGPTLRECLLMHAVARLALHGAVSNIQASWVKMGPQQAARLLRCGANDMGGVLMNESITRAAGAQHGQELGPAAMDALIRDAGRTPRQRTTLYGTPAAAQVAASYEARPLQPL